MDTIGKVLRKTGAVEAVSQSAHKTTQYEKLTQEASDEDVEDDVVFLQEGAVLHRNGFAANNHNEIISAGMTKDDAALEGLLQKGKVSSKRPVGSDFVQVKTARWRWRRILNRRRVAVILLILLFSLITTLVSILVAYRTGQYSLPTSNWMKEYNDYGTESCVRLVDVDEDGKLDIIFSMARLRNTSIDDLFHDNASQRSFDELCHQRGETYPCLGALIALRGNDSSVLWTTHTHAWMFELNCGNIDINKDGQMDCVGTGRFATIVAFDPRNGSVFWEAKSVNFMTTWSSFNVLVMPDFTGDGVPELITAHSSDPRFPPEEHDRFAGRLILLDGATGKSIGRYLAMPGGLETYMSPVLHTLDDGSAYILFGHGGETVPGAFLTISVPDFYRYVKQLNAKADVPNTSGQYSQWKFLPVTQNEYVHEIYRSTKAGVMVPPVCVDVDADGVHDILMLTFDGHLALYNGKTLKPIWIADFHGMQSYSLPAPGYFNDDDTVDFMLHLNHGVYPDYDYSMTVVVDGVSGRVIWSFNTTKPEMSSDLVMRTSVSQLDFFVFRANGQLLLPHSNTPQRVRRHEASYDGGWTPKPAPSSLNGRGSFGRKPYFRSNVRPWPGQTGRRQGPMIKGPVINDYAYTAPRQNFGRRRPVGRGGPAGQPGDFYSSSYDDAGQNAYPDYIQPYEYDDVRGMPWPGNRQLPYDDSGTSSDEVNDFSDQNGDREFSSEMTTVSANSGTSAGESSVSGLAACDQDYIDAAVAGTFVVSRDIKYAPLHVHRDAAVPFHYQFSEAGKQDKRHIEESNNNPRTQLSGKEACVLLTADERTTGGIGDVDGDGTLDLISVTSFSAEVTDEFGQFVRTQRMTRISKLNLELHLKRPVGNDFVSLNSTQPAMHQPSQLRFQLSSHQPWTAYLGARGDSSYRLN